MSKSPTPQKKQTIRDFRDHVSSGKVDFFQKYGMDFVMGRREGPYLYDLDGQKRLFNLHCNGGVFNLGHRNEELITLLKASLDDLDIGNHHLLSSERAKTARLLASLMPVALEYVVFGVSGGEAVDLAIKVARAYTRKEEIISADGGYHGHTGLAMAAGDKKYRAPFGPAAPGFRQVPFDDISALRSAVNANTAAVLLETIPATLGMVMPSPGYLKAVREVCNDAGALLILDEVQTGLGRTGKLWAFQHYDVEPDMVILGKGLSGGIYPISATVLHQKLESVFHKDPFIHISTFGGAELGCRIASQVLEISSDAKFLKQVNVLAGLFAYGIGRLQQKHPGILKGLRQQGLMIGLVLKDTLSGPALTKAAYDHDLLMIYANNDSSVCQFLPPLTITENEVDVVLKKLDRALSAAEKLRLLLKSKSLADKLLKPVKKMWNR